LKVLVKDRIYSIYSIIYRCKHAKSKLEYRYFDKYSIYLSINILRKQAL
jgi:hypothetical protein